MENKLTPELIEKAKSAKSEAELLALAKENGVELTEEQAKAYFEQLHKSGELSDEELDNVAGGGCYSGNRLVVTIEYSCDHFICSRCATEGKRVAYFGFVCPKCTNFATCKFCKFCSYEKGLWLCNHPENIK